jgi:nitrite reductase/ring-hydroxylating ferredoxin subunit
MRVGNTFDVPAGTGRTFEVEGRRIALFNVAGTFHAIDDLCSHMGSPLGDGRLDGRQVICPWHGARFDVTSGRVMTPPAGSDVQSYAVRVEESSLLVDIDSTNP